MNRTAHCSKKGPLPVSRIRESLLGISLLLVNAALPLHLAGQSVESEIDPIFARHNVVALGHTSPDFRDTLVKLIGSDNVATCQPVLPYTLIIKSANPVPVSMVVVRYSKLSSDGEAVEGLSVVRVGKSIGAGIVITPDTALSQVLNHARSDAPTAAQAALARSMPMYNTLFGARFPRGRISLDSIVFNDGGILGPDRLDIASVERGKLVIEDEIMAGFADESKSDAELKDWLTVLSRVPSPSGNAVTSASGQLAMYKISIAKGLLTRFKEPRLGGRPSIIPTLNGYRKQRMPAAASLHKLQ